MDSLYKIIDFSDDDKWFVIATNKIDDIKYSYLVRVNKEEDDIIDEYKVVRSYFSGSDEYFDEVNDGEILKKIMPILVPGTEEYINNPEKLKDVLNSITSDGAGETKN